MLQLKNVVYHGAYYVTSIYEIIQHNYVGGGDSGSGGYVEVLEIKNPPDGKNNIVIHEWLSDKGSIFTEWQKLEDAQNFFEKNWSRIKKETLFPIAKGFLRLVICQKSTPWFYAKENETVIGDFVVEPNYLF